MFSSSYGTLYYVDDMDKAVQFYKSLGLTPGHQSPEWTEIPVGSHNICLHSKRAGENYAPNGIMIFNATGVKALYEKMGREGIKVFGLHDVHPGASTFHMKDVSGNEFSIYGAP